MYEMVIIIAGMFLLSGLLMSEKKESLKGILCTKPLLSALFIVMAMVQPHPFARYYSLVLCGLIFCFIGDICLAFFFHRLVFTLGLAAFLIGHLFYTIAFFATAGITLGAWISLAAIIILSSVVYLKLAPYLDTMKGPVIAYIVIISLMVIGAGSLALNPEFTLSSRLLVLSGAILFYISDLFVARHRFVKKEIINRYAGLPMYNTAQFMLAFSVGIMG